MSKLLTTGVIHNNALKKGNKALRLDKEEYSSIPSSFLAFFVGLVDGDGYIQVTETSKGFIAIRLVISLHLEDLSTPSSLWDEGFKKFSFKELFYFRNNKTLFYYF